jgi:predicted TIM-barrel fold metal-dependent hydrolase
MLTGMAAVATALTTSANEVDAQGGTSQPRRIDVHHHHTGNDWVPARVIEAMDQYGIATAILSRPDVPVSAPEQARKLARETNEFGARLSGDYPGRFGFFATLPLFDVEGSLHEIVHAFDVLKADGVCHSTSYANKWIGHPDFEPVFAELNRRRAVAFVHPVTPPGAPVMTPKIPGTALENQFDTARGVVSLILNGTLMRCPDIKFIFCHGGGALLTLHERLDHFFGENLPPRTDGGSCGYCDPQVGYRSPFVPNGFDNELRKLYFDTVRTTNPVNFALLTALLPPDRLLFGSDYPPVPMAETASRLPSLKLESRMLRGLERENALTLFPRFKV